MVKALCACRNILNLLPLIHLLHEEHRTLSMCWISIQSHDVEAEVAPHTFAFAVCDLTLRKHKSLVCKGRSV
jgi:hypothetical protein